MQDAKWEMGIWSQVILNTCWAANLRFLSASFLRCSKGNSPSCSETTVYSTSLPIGNAYVSSVENLSPWAHVVPVALGRRGAGGIVACHFQILYDVNTDFSKFSWQKNHWWREFGFEMSSGMFICVEFCHAIWICDEPHISHYYLWGVWPLKAKCNLWQDF